MLKIDKSISLTGYCVVNEGGVNANVVYLNASVSTDGNSNGSTTKSVLNQDLYFRHRKEIRKDMSDFDDAVFAIEDELASEKRKNNTKADSVTLYKTEASKTIVAPTNVKPIEVNSNLEEKKES
ncbi:hypothetical protein [Clostridium tarantellae]|uniref:Uncharacterized protein n=1 Tax=Clostridium tarantellae TaxID=39493 RepID=A0A6I1MML8_9CLOT|nr:hypothetical protein [Clostridium tarantellae]MPQ44210.1 hypothetical protein [Clostridium tarantellae]